jgi:hypothetical protein
MSTDSIIKCDICEERIHENENLMRDGFTLEGDTDIQALTFFLSALDSRGDSVEDVDVCINCLKKQAGTIRKVISK